MCGFISLWKGFDDRKQFINHSKQASGAPFIDPTQLGQGCPLNRGLSSKYPFPTTLKNFALYLLLDVKHLKID